MKTKVKRLSKRSLAVVLTLLMMVSMLYVGTISADAWTESQCYIHLQIGSGSWTDYYMSNGKIYFYVSSKQTCKWDLVAENTWYKRNGSDTIPNGGSSSTNYYAKTSGSDFSASLSAGLYCVTYSNRYDNNATLEYQFYRVNYFKPGSTIYFNSKVSGTSTTNRWDKDSAKINAWFFNGSGSSRWASGTACPDSDSHVYRITVPAASDGVYHSLLFARSSDVKSGTTFGSVYNQSVDLDASSTNQDGGAWYPNALSGTTSSNTLTSTTHTHTLTRYKFIRDNSSVSTYTQSGSATTTNPACSSSTVNLNDSYSAPSGYTLDGWYTTNSSGTLTGAVASPTAVTNKVSATYYAAYTHNKVTVNFKNASGTGGTVSQGGTQKISSLTTSNQAVSTDYNRSLAYTITPASGYKIDSVSGGGTWSIASGGASATCTFAATGTTNVTVTQSLNSTPSLDSIGNVSKTVNDTTFNVTADVSNYSYASGSLSATATSGTESVATVGSPTYSAGKVTIPVTVKGPGTSAISVTLKDGTTTMNSQSFDVEVATPTFSIANKTITAEASGVAAPTVTDGGTTPSSIEWSSGTTANVTINSSTGALTAKKLNSSSTITAIAHYACGYTKSDTCTVTVSNPTLTIQSSATSGKIGDTATASVKSASNPSLSNSTVASYLWSTSDSTIIGISDTSAASPTLTFKKNGTATIKLKVTYKNNSLYKESATVSITVSAPTVSLTTTTAQTLNVGSTHANVATGSTLGSAASGSISYSVGSSTNISVNSSGTVTGLTPTSTAQTMTATYTVTCGGQTTTATATCNYTVRTPSITQGDVTIAKGDSKTLSTATTNPSSGLTVTFELSGSPNGVTCTSAGVVTVAQNSTASTATVVATAKNSGGTTVATKNITVTIETPTLTVKDGSTSVADGTVYSTVGTNKALTVGQNFSGDVTAKSANTSIATVSLNNGTLTITPVAKGTTKVSVSTDSGYTPTNAPAALLSASPLLLLGATPSVATQTVEFTVNVAEAETYKYLYFTNGVNWSGVKAYLYGDGSNASFPGESMVKIGKNEENKDVYAIRYPATKNYNKVIISNASDNSKRVQLSGSSDLALSSSQNAFWCNTANNDSGAGQWNCTIVKPQIQANDVTIDMGSTQTMTATVLNNVTPSTFNWSSGTTSIATTADTHTASNVITSVAPGNSTITVKAYAEKPSGWDSIVTDGTADDYVAGTTTATATVVAENKTVTFGAKKTDDGSTFTDLSGAVTAKYYDADTSGSGSSGSGSGSDPEPAGGPYYLHIGKQNAFITNTAIEFTWNGSYYYASYNVDTANADYPFVINTKNTALGDSDKSSSNQSITALASSNNPDNISMWYTPVYNSYYGYDAFKFGVNSGSTGTIYITFTPSGGVTFRTSVSSGSGGSGGSGGGESGSGTGYTGEGTTMTSPQSVPYGKVAVFTAEATKTVSDVTYHFAEWVDGSGNKLSSDNPYQITVTANQTVYARYYKVFKLSAFDSYTSDGTNVNFVTSPPKVITVKHGDITYTYTYDGTEDTGNPDSPDGNHAAALPIESGTYGQGNYIQYYAGDEITLYYSAMASSEIFKGVFYNNSENYYVAKPTVAQYVPHDYSAGKTLYMNSNYYETVPSGLPSTTVDHDSHSIKFTGTKDYKNIDIEIANKRKVYFSDYTNAVIGSKNTDDYYYDGEALSVTGDQLTVKAAGNAAQTNSIDKDNIKFYRADANGQKTGSELSGFTVAYDSGTDPVTNSGATASTRYIIISGNMPTYDLYIDLNMTNSYTIKLGSKVMADPFESKTRLSQIATVTIKEGSTTKLTAPSDKDVSDDTTSVNSGATLSLGTAYTGSWGNYYTFVGWYWGDDSAPDFDKGFISSKETASYIPKKGGTIWAVATRSLYINGSKYITGKDSDWYKENNIWKNLEMKFDPDRGTKGSYYWEITDTMFASAGNDFKTTETSGTSTTEGRYYKGGDNNYYWNDNSDTYHGKSFFQILDSETGYNGKNIWKQVYSFVETADGTKHGKIYPVYDEGDSTEYKRTNGQGFIDFAESRYDGYSSPLRIYLDADTKDLDVVATSIYSNIYVSNGFTVGSTLRTSNVTVQPVADGVVKTSGQAGYFDVNKQGNGWDPDIEGHVNHYKPKKKNATVRITKTAGGSDKIEAFFIYDITNKTVRAERDVKNSGSNYYIDLTLAGSTQNLYIVPIVEEAGANVTVSFDATQLNRKQWGDIVTAYAWYQSGGNALGGYPGQPMIPSDDMNTWTTKFKGTNASSKEIEGITFSNYVDGIHSWLGCSGVMGTVTYGGSGTSGSPTTVSIADDGLIKQYNYIESGNYKEYSRANFKAQTYDYREPIALYDRFKSADNVSISFSMKDGNSSLISWRHTDLTSHNIVTLEPDPSWGKLNWEYLSNAKGDKYIDMNGNTIKTKPTASFYVAAKGQVLYNNSSMTNVFYSGKQFDGVSGVTYGGASGVSMNYAVQWYVYDAQGNYITNVLTAGIADLASGSTSSYIGKQLEDRGYAVTGKSVAICYDKPRYMYGDSNTASSGQAAGYNGKGINVGNDFDAYRFTGQWNAVASNELVKVNVGVGMMTDSGEVLASSNTTGYGNATASYDTTKGNNTAVTNEDGDNAPFTASDGSFVRTAVRDAENSPVKLNASAQNFIGWYYYDANTGDFVKANYASNENFYPNYSNKDVKFYAMYRASAVYQYKYTGREGARTYSAAGNDLSEYELGHGSVIRPADHEADIKLKVPVGIGIFKENIDFTATNYDSWTKTADSNGYVLDITGFATSTPTYTLTAHYKDANGDDQTITKTAVYNGSAVNLTDLNGGSPVTAYYNKPFLGWYAYDGGTIGELISTQTNYGLRLTRNQAVIAVYGEDGSSTVPEASQSWHVSIDENEVNKELTTSDTGVYYNDTIVRVRNGADVRATLPSGAKIGVLVVCDNKTNETINGYTPAQLTTLANAVTSGSTKKTAKGLSITNMQATSQTTFNRTDIAVRRDYKTTLGAKYCVYAYIKDGSTYTFSDVSAVKTYE